MNKNKIALIGPFHCPQREDAFLLVNCYYGSNSYWLQAKFSKVGGNDGNSLEKLFEGKALSVGKTSQFGKHLLS